MVVLLYLLTRLFCFQTIAISFSSTTVLQRKEVQFTIHQLSRENFLKDVTVFYHTKEILQSTVEMSSLVLKAILL